MRFEFATATRIIFGPGTLSQAGPLAREMGAPCAGRHRPRPGPRRAAARGVDGAELSYVTLSVAGEPTIDLARRHPAGR